MHYQEILKSHFIRRSTMNPRYSLRAFAGFIELSPSKLSEIWSRKKGLSLKRAQDICNKLKLDDEESLIFLTSVEAQHHRDLKVRRKKLEDHEALLRVHNNKQEDKTDQRCAWYFGAIQKIQEILPQGKWDISELLQISPLQVENAQRFIKRLPILNKANKKIHLEPLSILSKIQEEFLFNPNRMQWETDFLFLDEKQLEEVKEAWNSVLKKYQKLNSENSELFLVTNHFIQVTKKGRKNV
jgi:hypothetical protein